MLKSKINIKTSFIFLVSGVMLIIGNVFPEAGFLFYFGLLLGNYSALKFRMKRIDAYFFLGPYFIMLGLCIWNYIFPYYTGILLALLLCDLFSRILYKLTNLSETKEWGFMAIPLFLFTFDFLFQKFPILNSIHMIPILSPVSSHRLIIKAASFWGGHTVLLILSVFLAVLMKTIVDFKITKKLVIVCTTSIGLLIIPQLFNNSIKSEDIKVNVSAVQGSYEPLDSGLSYEEEIERRLKYYIEIVGNMKTDIIVFPETPFGLYDISNKIDEGYRKNLIDASKQLEALSVFCQIEGNSITQSKEERFFSAMLFDDGDIIGTTRKRNLVPFTETKQYSKGKAYDIYETKYGKVGISICYDINSRTVERLKKNGAQMILAPFNDSGFGKVYHNIHRYYPVIKATECSIPIVVANEDGISQIVSRNGEILEELNYRDKGVISHTIEMRDTLSIYLLIGQYIEAVLFLIVVGWVIKSMINTKS